MVQTPIVQSTTSLLCSALPCLLIVDITAHDDLLHGMLHMVRGWRCYTWVASVCQAKRTCLLQAAMCLPFLEARCCLTCARHPACLPLPAGTRSRLGSMSDDKRRAAAAELAMRMASLMCADGEDEEGEWSDDSGVQ
jgi:hypothetical protein